MNGTRVNDTKPTQAWGVAEGVSRGLSLHVLQIRRLQVTKLSQACMQVIFWLHAI